MLSLDFLAVVWQPLPRDKEGPEYFKKILYHLFKDLAFFPPPSTYFLKEENSLPLRAANGSCLKDDVYCKTNTIFHLPVAE